MATYAFDIWGNQVPVLLIGGNNAFEIWSSGVPFVQETEGAPSTIDFLAAGSSTATVGLSASYQMAVQADGNSTATIGAQAVGFVEAQAAGDSAATVIMGGTALFSLQAAGDSVAAVNMTATLQFIPAPFDGDSTATVELTNKPFVYPATLIFGF